MQPQASSHLADWIDRNEADWARAQTDETLQLYAVTYRQLAREMAGDSREIAVNRYRIFERELRWRRSPKANPDRTQQIMERKERVKQIWPIETFCTQLLGCRLEQRGRDSLFANCPLPGHNDASASFHITPSKGLAHCFGCQRGGDIIDLTRMVLGIDQFTEILERLEQESGLAA